MFSPVSWSPENFQHKPVFTHILFWAQIVGPSHTLQFPQALFYIYFHIYLSTGSSGLKHHRLFFCFSVFVFFSVRKRTAQACRGKDAEAQMLAGSLSSEPEHILEYTGHGSVKDSSVVTLVTAYRWGRDRAQWLLTIFLLLSGKLWISIKEIS